MQLIQPVPLNPCLSTLFHKNFPNEPVPNEKNSHLYKVRGLNESGEEVISASIMEKAIKNFKILEELYNKTAAKLKDAAITCLYIDMADETFTRQAGDAKNTAIISVKAKTIIRYFNRLEFIAAPDVVKTNAAPTLKSSQAVEKDLEFFANALMDSIFRNKSSFSTVKQIPHEHAVFPSQIYNSYFKQMRAFVLSLKVKYPKLFLWANSPEISFLKHPAIELVNIVLNVDLVDKYNLQQFHEEIVDHLRDGVTRSHKQSLQPALFYKQCDDFLEDFSKWIFTGPNLEEDFWKLLQNSVPKLKVTPLESIEDVYWIFFKLFNDLKLIEHFHFTNNDFYKLGNLPSKLWDFLYQADNNSKTTQFIRMANPTIKSDDRDNKQPFKITPELIAFLRKLEKEGKSLLIVHFLHTRGDSNSYQEEFKSSIVHALETDYGFKNVKVFGVDRNTAYYLQIGKFADDVSLNNPETYKRELLRNLTDKGGELNCYWSEAERDESKKKELKAKLNKCIHEVHRRYFEDYAEMDPMLRTIFNELVYVEFLDEIAENNLYDFIAAFCNASVDRGPTFLALWRLKHLIESCTLNSQQEIQLLLANIFGNALFIENRAPSLNRVFIFLRAAQMMVAAGPKISISCPS